MAQTTFDRARCFNCPLAHSKGKRSCTDHDETIIREALLKISVFFKQRSLYSPECVVRGSCTVAMVPQSLHSFPPRCSLNT